MPALKERARVRARHGDLYEVSPARRVGQQVYPSTFARLISRAFRSAGTKCTIFPITRASVISRTSRKVSTARDCHGDMREVEGKVEVTSAFNMGWCVTVTGDYVAETQPDAPAATSRSAWPTAAPAIIEKNEAWAGQSGR